MTTWTMYYGPHAVQRGLSAQRAVEHARQWEACIQSGQTSFQMGVLVPITLEHAEVKLRASIEVSVAFLPDTKS